MSATLRRRFVSIGSGRVHLWTGGRGPALILMHGSPGNAWLVRPLAERLLPHFSVYAFDTPGFGRSDALPGPVTGVAQLADAYRDILDALGLERVLVYGTHSGAAIGLELCHRHPARVAGFVLEGVPAFTIEEQQPLLDPQYLVALEPDILGGQYARAWTRFHDQFVWFPWYSRTPEHLNEADAGSAAEIHLWVEMYFQAMRHDYRAAYRAVISYGADALAAAAAVRAPGVYLAERSDMLFAHLDRLPSLRAGQRIERVQRPGDVPACIESALRSLPASSPGVTLDALAGKEEEYIHDLPGGGMLVRERSARDGHSRTPILLLHDAPGAGREIRSIYDALCTQYTVLLPDLPGCGESDSLPPAARRLEHYADTVAGLLTARLARPVHVHAIGFGAAVALEVNARHPDLICGLSLTGLLRTTRPERLAMLGRLAPPIELAEDGSHWYRTWLMLRDSLVRWPWYAREPKALRRQTRAFDAEHLHAWTCDVMRQWHAYQHLIDAVLEWMPDTAIAAAADKLTIAADPHNALYESDLAWSATGVASLILPAAATDRARLLGSLLA
jgi:pimeloyl-ACP methyl ester carboxylesterase